MAWRYLHLTNVPDREFTLQAISQAEGESALQMLLNRYGAAGWELVFCQQLGESYELIFKSESGLMR
jgi:hypothetical protein